MTTTRGARRQHLVLAAVLAGVAGLGLVALGWWIVDWQHQTGWSRLEDGTWWAGLFVRMMGFLAIGKAGFKVALAVVLCSAALVVRWKRRRVEPVGPPRDGTEATG